MQLLLRVYGGVAAEDAGREYDGQIARRHAIHRILMRNTRKMVEEAIENAAIRARQQVDDHREAARAFGEIVNL